MSKSDSGTDQLDAFRELPLQNTDHVTVKRTNQDNYISIDNGPFVEASQTRLCWSMFAHPVEYDGSYYVFQTDQKSIHEVDKSVFQQISYAVAHENGHDSYDIRNSLSSDQIDACLEAGLLTTMPPEKQFTQMFSKSTATDEYELLHLVTSYTCNLSCSYCFMLEDKDEHEEWALTFEDAKEGIDLFFSKPTVDEPVIHFYGGEPLLRPDFIDNCMKYIHENYTTDAQPKIITNGTLFDEDTLFLFEKYDFDLSVSMDGDRQAHDVFRVDHQGNSSFDDVVGGIETIQKFGQDPKVLITVGEHNIERLPEITEFILSLDPKAIALNYPRELPDSDNGLGVKNSSTFWVNQYQESLQKCFEHGIPELYYTDMLWNLLSGDPSLRPCAACGAQLSVGPGGEVGPCQAFLSVGQFSQPLDEFDADPVAPDLTPKNGTEHQCGESSGECGCDDGTDTGAAEREDPFEEWKEVSKASSEKCSKCSISPICGGDCSYSRYNSKGTLHEPVEFHCEMRLGMAETMLQRFVDSKPVGFTGDFTMPSVSEI